MVARDPSRPAAFYVPAKLNDDWFAREWRECVYFFLNLLHWKWVSWQGEDADGTVRLKHAYLTRIIPAPIWPAIRDRLIGKGVVYCDYTFAKGRKSYGYRLQPSYRRTRRVLCQVPALNRKIQAVFGAGEVPLCAVHHWLQDAFEHLNWDIAAMRALADAGTPDDPGRKVEEYQQQLHGIIDRIANGDLWFVVDRYGRLHTPLTSMPRAWRPCVGYRGQPLAGLDLANSQPLLAGLCARQFYSDRYGKHRLLERSFDASNKAPYRYTTQRAKRTNQGVEDYIRLCEDGRLYESLMQPGDDRRRFKERFYAEVFFGSNRWPSPLQARFEDRHPAIATMLRKMKAKDHRRSAWILQNYEATLFLGVICNRIRQERPRTPVFTIHDALLTTPAHLPYITTVVREEFGKLDCSPTLRTLKGDIL